MPRSTDQGIKHSQYTQHCTSHNTHSAASV